MEGVVQGDSLEVELGAVADFDGVAAGVDAIGDEILGLFSGGVFERAESEVEFAADGEARGVFQDVGLILLAEDVDGEVLDAGVLGADADDLGFWIIGSELGGEGLGAIGRAEDAVVRGLRRVAVMIISRLNSSIFSPNVLGVNSALITSNILFALDASCFSTETIISSVVMIFLEQDDKVITAIRISDKFFIVCMCFSYSIKCMIKKINSQVFFYESFSYLCMMLIVRPFDLVDVY